MFERKIMSLVAGLGALLVLAMLWDAFVKPPHRARSAAPPVVVDTARSAPVPAPPRPETTATRAVENLQPVAPNGPSYMELLARSEIRRRIRASAGFTYLNDVVAESEDSALHRWDNRINSPVRVYLATGTAANFQSDFLDAVRGAFQRWEDAGVPVRFDVSADSASAEVRFRWKVQFDIERTGETHLTWDQGGHLLSGDVTLATFDPKGRPLGVDDVRVVALHEIGHLIGLDHSPDSTDLMYAATKVRDLSSRDVQTARLLYQLAPGPLR